MFEEVTHTRSRWRVFWPEVDDLAGAREAIRLSVWFVFLAAGLSAIAAVIGGVAGPGRVSGLGGAVLFGLVGWGLQRKSRVAAIAGTALLGIGGVVAVSQRHLPGVVDLLTFVALLSGVRGTFAHRRLSRAAAIQGDPPVLAGPTITVSATPPGDALGDERS